MDANEEAHDEKYMAPEIYWKQAKLFGFAVLCYSVGELHETDLKEMAELVVLYRYKRSFASEDSRSESLDQAVTRVMASRIAEILEAKAGDSLHLSRCFKLVYKGLPDGLKWAPISSDGTMKTGCFEAASPSGIFIRSIS